MSGLHEALLVAAVVSFLGAIAGLFVSRGEHREGALPVIG